MHFFRKTLSYATLLLLTNSAIQADDSLCDCNVYFNQSYDQYGFFIEGDLLYWKPTQDNLDYAIDDDRDLLPSPHTFGPGKIHYIEYDWDFSYRVVGGYRAGCNGWDTTLIYTNFHGEGKDSVDKVGTTEAVAATLLVPETTPPTLYAQAEATIDLFYSSLDFVVGRTLDFRCDTIHLRPYFGLRVQWIKQNLKADYQDPFLGTDPLYIDADSILQVDYEISYHGVGWYGGVQYDQNLWCGLGIYANGGGSLVAGTSDSSLKQNNVIPDGDSTTVIPNVLINDSQWLVIPTLQLEVGLRYETYICNRRFVRFKVGYEFVTLWDTPQYRHYFGPDLGGSAGATDGSFSMQGITAKLEYHF